MKRFFAIAILSAGSASSFSQITYASFSNASFSEVSVKVLDDNNQAPRIYDVVLGADPTITIGQTTYQITSLSGFFSLSWTAGNSLDATMGAGGGWAPSASIAGDVAGWDDPSATTLLLPGNDFTCTYQGIGFPSFLYGFDVEYTGADAKTKQGYFREPSPTPEPFTLSVGIAGLGLALRRRLRARDTVTD